MKKQKTWLEPETKMAEPIDLRVVNTNIIVEKLEQDIKLREMGLLQKLKPNRKL